MVSPTKQFQTFAPSADGSPGYIILPIAFSNGSSTPTVTPSSSLCQSRVRPSLVAIHSRSRIIPIAAALSNPSCLPLFSALVTIVRAALIADLKFMPITCASRSAILSIGSPCRIPCSTSAFIFSMFHATSREKSRSLIGKKERSDSTRFLTVSASVSVNE